MRDKKYVGPANMVPTTATSSNDSGSVSVVSNEETASFYSIQSMSPDNSTYLNGNSSNDSNSATYPNDGFEHDLSLVYSSGFYDNSGYFYVNRKQTIIFLPHFLIAFGREFWKWSEFFFQMFLLVFSLSTQ